MTRRLRLGISLFVLLTSGPVMADDALQTVAEQSGYKATARHDDVLALCKALDESSDAVRLDELGKSGEGRSIPLLFVANPMVKSPEEAKRSGKLVILIVGNIHAGEVCGKEALPMLVREIIAESKHPLLEDLILAVVPNFNPDGNERVSKTNRPGQHGPEDGTGQRGNAQGLDLNRDFVKLEAPETRALARFLNRWDPHIVIDTHTTNGSLHRYVLTYQGPQNPAGDRRIIDYVHRTMLPAIDKMFEGATGRNAFFYGNFADNHTRWTGFPDTPRFGTNYVGLRNRISILTEAYAYASFEDRVRATRDFVRACLEYASKHKDEILKQLDEVQASTIAAGLKPGERNLVIRSRVEPFPEPVTVLGYVEQRTNGRPVAGDPKDYEGVALVQKFEPSAEVDRPYAYLIPPGQTAAIEALQRHGIQMSQLREDVDLPVHVTRIARVDRASQTFEGHQTVEVRVENAREETRSIEAGTVLVQTSQPLGTLGAYLLEPESADGLTTWNVFDNALAVGSDFPVVRLMAPLPFPVATAPIRPLPEDREEKKRITFEQLWSGHRPNLLGSPLSAQWLDNRHLLQVKAGRIYKVDARTGQAEPFHDPEAMAHGLATLPTIDESAARSIARRTSFEMDPEHKGALIEHDEDLYYATFDGKTAVRLTSTRGAEEMPSFSPDGRFVAFVRDNDLYVVDLTSQTERALTSGGTNLVRNGKADWVYYEEIFNRNWKAYWWSPDSKHLAFLQCDDHPVGTHAVLNDLDAKRVVEETPYPRAGDPNPRIKLGLVPTAGGPVVFADLTEYSPDSFLISDVGWWPDGQSAYCYAQDRTQTWLDVVKVSARDGRTNRLFRETTKAWVESLGPLHILDDGSILLLSERDGWKHLYLYNPDGTLKKQVTSGEWEIRSVDHVDRKKGVVLFTATRDNPVATSLYSARIDDGSIERLTKVGGSHRALLSPDGQLALDTWSDASTPPRIALLDASGKTVRILDSNPVSALDEYQLASRERVQIKARDGFVLEAELVLPHNFDPEKRYPVWFSTYGGPHAPTISDGWAAARLFDQALASDGFVVFHVDPRSASGKGAASAWAAYRRLGIQELEDIKDAIAWLKQKPFVDGSRIGMSGHSYGGFMTAFALTHSDLFAAGIAGAPVTDWHDYDSIYTERYMSTPQDNPEGYEATSVVKAAKNLHGRLLILHGAIDDNVSLRNTMRLVHALQQADKDFELMIYPSARHGIFGRHYDRLQVEFIRRALGGGPKAKEPNGP